MEIQNIILTIEDIDSYGKNIVNSIARINKNVLFSDLIHFSKLMVDPKQTFSISPKLLFR